LNSGSNLKPALFCDGFFEIESQELLAGLASNRAPLDLGLLSSWDYRREPPAPGSGFGFFWLVFFLLLLGFFLEFGKDAEYDFEHCALDLSGHEGTT
jgi:hypothetical protein